MCGVMGKILIFISALMIMVVASANEKDLRNKIIKQLGDSTKIQGIKKMPYGDLYEVYMNDRIHYTDANFTFMIIGALIDVRKNINVSDQSLRQYNAVSLKKLPPLEQAIAVQKAIPNHENNAVPKQDLYVFSDPLCPQCQDFEKVLVNFPELNIYVFLMPNDAVNRGSSAMSKAIWCSQNPQISYLNFMRKGIVPEEKIRPNCELNTSLIYDAAEKFGIKGTPGVVFSDGYSFYGKIDDGRIRSLLRNNPNANNSPTSKKK